MTIILIWFVLVLIVRLDCNRSDSMPIRLFSLHNGVGADLTDSSFRSSDLVRLPFIYETN